MYVCSAWLLQVIIFILKANDVVLDSYEICFPLCLGWNETWKLTFSSLCLLLPVINWKITALAGHKLNSRRYLSTFWQLCLQKRFKQLNYTAPFYWIRFSIRDNLRKNLKTRNCIQSHTIVCCFCQEDRDVSKKSNISKYCWCSLESFFCFAFPWCLGRDLVFMAQENNWENKENSPPNASLIPFSILKDGREDYLACKELLKHEDNSTPQ